MVEVSEEPQQPSTKCPELWRSFYALRAKYLAAVISLVPGSLVVGIAFEKYGVAPFLLAAAVGLFAYFVFGSRLGLWPCPRRGNTFAGTRTPTRIPLSLSCIHCGLEAGSCPKGASFAKHGSASTVALLVALVAVQAVDAQSAQLTLGEPTCATCRIVVEPVVTLQTPDGGAGSPWATIRTKEGQYVIAEPDRIHIFAANGQYIRTIGRKGQGPGEYGLINFVGVLGDRVHVFDAMQRRQTVLSPDWNVIRLNPFAGSVSDVLVVADSLTVVSGRIVTREGAGHPLHAQDHAGRVIRSFGEPPDGYRAGISANVYRRQLAKASSGGIWAAHRTRYQIDQWDLDGRLRRTIVRNASWFPPHLDERPMRPDPRIPPAPHLMAVREDDQERLWILIQVADTGWAGAVRSASVSTNIEGSATHLVPDRAYDTMLEVIDLRTGALLASRRFDQLFRRFVAEDIIHSVYFNPDDTTVAHLWRLRLEGLLSPSSREPSTTP